MSSKQILVVLVVFFVAGFLYWQSDSTDTNTEETPETKKETVVSKPPVKKVNCTYSHSGGTKQVQVKTCTTITTNTIQIRIMLERLDDMNDHTVKFWLDGYSAFPRECLFSAKNPDYTCDYKIIRISEGDYRVDIQLDNHEKENASPTFTLG